MTACLCAGLAAQRAIDVPRDVAGLQRLDGRPDESGRARFAFPPGADALVVPFGGGLVVDRANAVLMDWLRSGSPWSLVELPLIGARYGDRMLAVVLPWPQYAQLVVGDSIEIEFEMPARRHDVAPCALMAGWTSGEPLALTQVFRQWREAATDEERGLIPARRPLATKAEGLEAVARLFGAVHLYLWGNAHFSHHDVDRRSWLAVARHLLAAEPASPLGRMVAAFSDEQRKALEELAAAEWPVVYATRAVASAIDAQLAAGRIEPGKLAAFLPDGVAPPGRWGDGISLPMLDQLQAAGIERAVLVTSDLHRHGIRREVVAHANELGYLFGPYDSYHSVHSAAAARDATWATAQFDDDAFEKGRVIRADGSGHGGFRGRGFHLAPAAAWPHVQERVGGMLAEADFSMWFVDCDATAECFEDYSELHPATRAQDLQLRRQRLSWLEGRGLVVGSEGGSVLFSDVVHYGHGVDVPYIGHLEPRFRERDSEHYLGRYWPSDTPEQSFKGVPLPERMVSPWFDPLVKVPLYRAAIGDELVATHHWGFDLLKFPELRARRELLGLLTMAPPLYHLSRAAFADRRAAMVRYVEFWAPLHRLLACAPLVAHERLDAAGLVQRTTYRCADGAVHIVVNFGDVESCGLPPLSCRVDGAIGEAQSVYLARDEAR